MLRSRNIKQDCKTPVNLRKDKDGNLPKSISLQEYVKDESDLTLKAGDSFRDRPSTLDETGKRLWIYPKKPKGPRYKARTVVSWFLLAFFALAPFVKIGGNQFLLFNVLEREFVIFGVKFWPQDFHLFAIAMAIIMLFVVLFTAVFGRVWCGWACPQTIFMEMVFRKIEYWIEGDANRQRQLDRMPWNSEKIRKKGLKAVIFYALSFLVSNLFLAYIIGSDALLKIISEPVSQHIAGFIAIILFSGVFFFVFWWFREQACTFVCPYGRLQSVLIDKSTIVVAYDYKRGERREKFKKKGQTEGAGDCIDCHKCEQVCPTGIDIKDGIQLECVNCTACMDACDAVMTQVGRPKGLIRYASLNQIETGESKVITPRIILYSTILVSLIALLVVLMSNRQDIDTTILREKGMSALTVGDGTARNIYSIKYINKSTEDKSFTLRLAGFSGTIDVLGEPDETLRAPANSVTEKKFLIDAPISGLSQDLVDFQIEIIGEDGDVIESKKVNFERPRKAIGQ